MSDAILSAPWPASAARAGLHIGDLPKWLLCVPLVTQWFWLAARHGSLTLPSTLDPWIKTGGLAGESKADCLSQIGAEFAPWVARWRCVADARQARAASFAYPLIAKPDIGWCGFGVRRIGDEAALDAYSAAFPRGAAFILQEFVAGPGEAGLYYVREPGAARGRVLGVTLRHAPEIVADGVRSVAELMQGAQPGLTAAALARVPPAGERVALTTVASLRVGGQYRDVTARLTPALDSLVDAMARSMPDFHVGRFDVRFTTLDALLAGRFTIIEVNGAGSEAIHLLDPALSMRAAFAGVFAKQRMLFRLGAAMRARGHAPVGTVALARAWLHQQRLIARYPASN